MPLVVPWQEIAADTLDSLMEEFVTRDGTDYGEWEVATATKVEQLRSLLKKGEASVVFDEVTETVSILTREQLREMGEF